MRRTGRFDLPGELAPIVQPALVVPVPRDIPTEGGTSRCASHSAGGQVWVYVLGSNAHAAASELQRESGGGAIHHRCSTSYRHQCGITLPL